MERVRNMWNNILSAGLNQYSSYWMKYINIEMYVYFINYTNKNVLIKLIKIGLRLWNYILLLFIKRLFQSIW